MGTALVIGLLIAMCGGIAYVGDLLGRRMGKKRLTILGLRPRHTAVIFTVVTGVVIATVTLGTLLLASAGVRVAVTQGERLLHERRYLDQMRRQLIERNGALNRKNVGLEESNKSLAGLNTALRGEREQLRVETTRLQQRNQALQEKNRSLSERNARLETRNARLLADSRALSQSNRRLAASNGRLARTNRTLVASNSGLKARNRGLQTANSGLQRANEVAQERLRIAQKDLKQTVAKALRVASEASEEAGRGAELKVGNVVVRRGEELARRVIPAAASADVVRGAIRSLLAAADAEVARRERRPPERPARVNVVSLGPVPMRLEAIVANLTIERHTADRWQTRRPLPEMHSQVIRAIARANAAAGAVGPIEVFVDAKLNRLAFRKGQEVASLEVETAATTGLHLKNLVAFLHRQVREAATERSILPDATGSVGEIDYESLLDVVGKIKRTQGRARVGAIAAADAWTAGPLRLDFYVVPADTKIADEKARP